MDWRDESQVYPGADGAHPGQHEIESLEGRGVHLGSQEPGQSPLICNKLKSLKVATMRYEGMIDFKLLRGFVNEQTDKHL